MSNIEKDAQFVRVIITGRDGRKRSAYLYKPQNLVCTQYLTVELLEAMGCKIEEVEQ